MKRAYWLADAAESRAFKRAENGGIVLSLPEHLPDPDVSVVVLEIDRPAASRSIDSAASRREDRAPRRGGDDPRRFAAV